VQIPFVSGEPLLEDHESLNLTDIHQVIVGGQKEYFHEYHN
jgi:protein gp37